MKTKTYRLQSNRIYFCEETDFIFFYFNNSFVRVSLLKCAAREKYTYYF
jgi:hypothetical protein